MLVFSVMLFLLLAGITAILGYYGMYAPVKIKEEVVGDELLVYHQGSGDYREIRALMDRIFKTLRSDFGIKPQKGFCVFYNHPNNPGKRTMKGEAGCLLPPAYRSSIDGLAENYSIAKTSREKLIITEFPMKSEFSLIISYMRIYPKLKKYARTNGYDPRVPVMEIYDKTRRRVVYRMKIKRKPKSI
ncbi:MAG: hypothetical protein K9I94_11590 [Bacteroidales bacterium]|nr:hypothetical protein [Bacteroidales bacterium]